MGEAQDTNDNLQNTFNEAANNLWMKNDQEDLICYKICKHKGNAKLRILQVSCVLCTHVFHAECVEITKEPHVWTCYPCSKMPGTVQHLCSKLDDIINQNNKLNTVVQENQRIIKELLVQCVETSAVVASLATHMDELRGMRTQVQHVVASMEKFNGPSDDFDGLESDDEDEIDVQPQGTLLIGDSLIRSLESTAEDLKINCLSGAKISDIKKALKQINQKKQKYKDLYIMWHK
jgi:hypothetical protein